MTFDEAVFIGKIFYAIFFGLLIGTSIVAIIYEKMEASGKAEKIRFWVAMFFCYYLYPDLYKKGKNSKYWAEKFKNKNKKGKKCK